MLLVLSLVACGPISIHQEKQLGAQFAREARRELPFVRDPTVVSYVRSIGEELVNAAGPQPFTYHFYVIEDGDINAFAAPAGYIYIHTGTILRARNVSELAGVMAHEVGHVARRHIAHNYNRQRNTGIFYQFFVLAAAIFGGGYAGQAAHLGGLAASAYINKFGRDHERDADAFAVEVMPKAGYDPMGLVTFFEVIARESGGGGGHFLSSHPAPRERIQNTRSLVQSLDLDPDLAVSDRGKLEIIQRRIRLLTGEVESEPAPL